MALKDNIVTFLESMPNSTLEDIVSALKAKVQCPEKEKATRIYQSLVNLCHENVLVRDSDTRSYSIVESVEEEVSEPVTKYRSLVEDFEVSQQLDEIRSSHETRIELRTLGWQSNDNYTHFGWGTKNEYGYSIHAERWDWHGERMDRISFGLTLRPDEVNPKAMDKLWDDLFKFVTKTYSEWTDSIPFVGVDGKLHEDTLKTSFFRNRKEKAKNVG